MKKVFVYKDYRKYISDFFKATKKSDPSFSFDVFSKRAHLRSRSFMANVIAGRRRLTHTSIAFACIALELGTMEALYFINLVGFNEAQTAQEKKFYSEKLTTLKRVWTQRAKINGII